MKKIISLFILIGLVTALSAGCSTKKNEAASSNGTASGTTAASNTASSGSNSEVKKVRVAVANDFNPYAYLDENGNYIGYEIDVLKKVDELLPQYEFEYQTVSDQFVALTSNKVDLIAHQWETNPERQKTYLFGKQLVTTWAAYIVFKDGRTDIQTLSDLEGKTVETYQGSNDAYFLETYNKDHNNAIKLVYSSGDTSVTLNQLDNGTIDAFLWPLRFVDLTEESYKVKLGTSSEPVYNSNTYFIYRKDDADETVLQEAVDGALKSITEDSTLKALSIQWLGKDYTTEAAIEENTSN